MGLCLSSEQEAGLCSQRLLPGGQLLGAGGGGLSRQIHSADATVCRLGVPTACRSVAEEEAQGKRTGVTMAPLGSLQRWEAQPLPETARSRASDGCRGWPRSALSRCPGKMPQPVGPVVGDGDAGPCRRGVRDAGRAGPAGSVLVRGGHRRPVQTLARLGAGSALASFAGATAPRGAWGGRERHRCVRACTSGVQSSKRARAAGLGKVGICSLALAGFPRRPRPAAPACVTRPCSVASAPL